MSQEWLKELSDEDRLSAIKDSFGRVKASEDGRIVMCFWLEINWFLQPIMTEEQRIRHNAAIELLQLFPGVEERIYAAVFNETAAKEKT